MAIVPDMRYLLIQLTFSCSFGAVLEDYEILDAMEEASANHAIPANLTW